MDLIDKKEVEIEYEGEILKYNISKFPATVGREIITQYPVANIPKVGDYKTSEETMLKLMKYVERVYEDRVIRLDNKDLVNNHIPDWVTLVKLEACMIDYNCSFFRNGKGLAFLKKLQTLAEPKIIEMLTALSGKLSQAVKQPSTN